MRLISGIRYHKDKINWKKDIAAGIIVALVSIPISMGYAQIAGLPAVYGLYGSVLPILVYGFLTTSQQYVVGVEAMPAAMAGGLLAELGIAGESEAAMQLVPLLAILTAFWLLVFYFLKAGRLVHLISMPVVGGFVSGIGITILLMQLPKLFGGNPGTGEVLPLLVNLWEQLPAFHPLSAALGLGTVTIILLGKRWIPKVPLTVVMMAVGGILQVTLHLDRYGVRLLPEAIGGIPKLALPDARLLTVHASEILMETLSIAAVIMAQTLLTTGKYAARYGDDLDYNAEILAFAGMNLAGGLVGCCPINGAASRSKTADSFGARSQVMSLSAAATMLLVLLFGTPLLRFLPVPVLTGIVVTGLISTVDFKLMWRLWQSGRGEWLTFMTSLMGVLIFGTVNGVMIGCMLSFAEAAVRAAAPPTAFIGRIPGKGNFYPLSRNSAARPIRNAVIYRFSGNLFFANVERFRKDIEQAIQPDTKVVVVDARGIGSVDITAADRVVSLYRTMKARGIPLYLAEHDGSLNDQFRRMGASCLLEEGAVRRTITLALQDVGLEKPYILTDTNQEEYGVMVKKTFADVENEQTMAELEWIFGDEAEAHMQKMAEDAAKALTVTPELLEEKHLETKWGHLSLFDEDEFLESLEMKLEEFLNEGILSPERIKELEKRVEDRRLQTERRLQEMDPKALRRLKEHREHVHEYLKEQHPEEFERMLLLQKQRFGKLEKHHPELARKLKELYDRES